MPSILWWGRSDIEYSRNRILRQQLVNLGWTIIDFHPAVSVIGDVEAHLRRIPKTNLVWVPCFRQRDMAAALRWCRYLDIPLLVDPLISAFDKQVDERGKLARDSRSARRLLQWESKLLKQADLVLADTHEHAIYFHTQLGVSEGKTAVVPVGAEEPLFHPTPLSHSGDRPLDVLFYGSYIPLQDPRVIVEAARIYSGPPVRWQLVGRGPLHAECVRAAASLENVAFEDWMDYRNLPARIHQTDVVLGIFGATPKAGRVIPNKVYQALACGRPVITRAAPAYDPNLLDAVDTGLLWVPPADPVALAGEVAKLAREPERLTSLASVAARTYSKHFSNAQLAADLARALASLGFT